MEYFPIVPTGNILKDGSTLLVQTEEDLDLLIASIKAAQTEYSSWSQEKVDAAFEAAAMAAVEERIRLAIMAHQETGRGVAEDKITKNHFAAEFIYNKYRNAKTCGEIEHDLVNGIKKIAEPIGVIAGIVPTTNPTSTAIFKALMAIKTRNAIIFSPHPSAKYSTAKAAYVVLKAAMDVAGIPPIIGWIDEPSVDLSNRLMKHPQISLILATGGPGMVKAAYSSGKPALGVGAGNTPAVIDETAHLKMAVSSVLLSKTFDNGMICASEQSVIIVDEVYEEVKADFIRRGAYVLSPSEKEALGKIIVQDHRLNPDIVGKPAQYIASLAGITVSENVCILVAECDEIGLTEAFSHEKLSPTLAMYRASDYKDATSKARELLEFGGIGHTAVYYTDQVNNQDRISYFSERMKAGRILINMPSSQGAIGDIYNFRLEPSLTLGCGSWGGNAISENVGIKHLLNVKTVAERRENTLWERIPNKIFFKPGSISEAFKDLKDKKRAFIVTDRPLFDLGLTSNITSILESLGIDHRIFTDVNPDPCMSDIKKGLSQMNSFEPDLIIAIGGGSPMDAAKIMWLMYEDKSVKFSELAMRFMDIRKRIYEVPVTGVKAMLVAIPTTAGTGSEVTPFAVVTDDKTGVKYPIASYELTPSMAIIDASLHMGIPKSLTAWGGIDALTHAVEAYVSVFASDFTNGKALDAIRIIFKYLPSAYKEGTTNLKAREKMANAATLAGEAFANAFLGICHSLAHKLGGEFHVPHGLANALLISNVIAYNSTDVPKKFATFPQYKYPLAASRYAKIMDVLATDEVIANYLGINLDYYFGELNRNENKNHLKVKMLIEAIEKLKADIGIPKSISEVVMGGKKISEAEFMSKVEALSITAFDDQCTGANPRYPLFSELKTLYIDAFRGEILFR